METIDRKYRGFEIWDMDDVAPAIRDEATAAVLAVLDLEAVSPLHARVAQFTQEAMDGNGVLNRAEPYLMLGVADWALSEWQAHDTDPTRI